MSTSRPEDCLSLADYIRGLLATLAAEAPAAHERLRRIVGPRRARIELDDEAVVVAFRVNTLTVVESGGEPSDGAGTTDRQTVLELLDGYLEVTAAVTAGRLHIAGQVDDVARMHHAIELLIDSATRAPGLQAVATTFREDPCRAPRRPSEPAPPGAGDRERALLERYDLLP